MFSPAAIDAVPATHGGRNYGRMLKENASWLALVCVFIFAAIRYPAFLSSENLLNILRQNSMLGLVSVGMTFVILSGGIDLSVGSLVAVGGVVAAELSYHGSLAAIACGLLAGGLLGLANGVLIARARLQPFVATLAMMIAVRGFVLAVTHEQSIRIAKTATALTTLGRGHVGTVPVPVLLVLAVFALGALVLAYSGFGHHVFAVGDSEEAAHLLGLDVARTKIAVYTLSGVLAGAAGVLLASRLGSRSTRRGNRLGVRCHRRRSCRRHAAHRRAGRRRLNPDRPPPAWLFVEYLQPGRDDQLLVARGDAWRLAPALRSLAGPQQAFLRVTLPHL